MLAAEHQQVVLDPFEPPSLTDLQPADWALKKPRLLGFSLTCLIFRQKSRRLLSIAQIPLVSLTRLGPGSTSANTQPHLQESRHSKAMIGGNHSVMWEEWIGPRCHLTCRLTIIMSTSSRTTRDTLPWNWRLQVRRKMEEEESEEESVV